MATEITSDEAKALYETKFWEDMSAREIAEFQLFTEYLCMPFDIFHKAVEEALGRPVWTHEFGKADGLRKQLRGEEPPPTMQEILELIPEEKRIVVYVEDR